VLALASGTIVLIVFGSIYTFGTLIPYISAYLYYNGDPTTSTALSLLFTLMVLTLNIGVAVERAVCKWLSNRVLCIIAVFGLCGSILLASIMTTFAGFLCFYGLLYGFFIGFGYFPPLKNAFLHLPARKGLCSGICMTGFGLGSGIFNFLIIGLVNPNNTALDPTTKMYPP
jgi:OFA family oxalate/formate antiporter-like MFS transporter